MTRTRFLVVLFFSVYLLVNSDDGGLGSEQNKTISTATTTTKSSEKPVGPPSVSEENNAKDDSTTKESGANTSEKGKEDENSQVKETKSSSGTSLMTRLKSSEEDSSPDPISTPLSTTISASVEEEIKKINDVIQYIPPRDQIKAVVKMLANEKVDQKKANEDIGALKILTETGKKANDEIGTLKEEIGALKIEKDLLIIPKAILVVLTRIDHLEKYLFPLGFKSTPSRYARWITILQSGDPKVKPFLDRIVAAYFPNDKAQSIECFARAMEKIYGDLSEKPHNWVDPALLNELRQDATKLGAILSNLGIEDDTHCVEALRVIAHPLELPVYDTTKKDDTADDVIYNCIQIFPLKANQFKDRTDNSTAVFEFFRGRKPTQVIFKSGDKLKTDKYIVRFETTSDAYDGLTLNLERLNGQQVTLQYSSNKDCDVASS